MFLPPKKSHSDNYEGEKEEDSSDMTDDFASNRWFLKRHARRSPSKFVACHRSWEEPNNDVVCLFKVAF